MTDWQHRLMLIDGHGVAYRQFHALEKSQTFMTIAGEPTSATFGFARALLDILLAPIPPQYLAVTFDQGLSGREKLYPEYKGTRPEMDNNLAVQLNRIRELVQTFNIPILEKETYEADDVIGSAARLCVAQGVDAYILTGDGDLLQLVDDHTLVEQQKWGGSTIYDTAGVIARYGIRPEQLPDYKGFVGDNSDNIPGVSGIGDKTAAQLLQRYNTLENVYEHLDEQKDKTRRLLVQGRDNAFLSKRLATIQTDLPLDLDLAKCVAHDYDKTVALRLFEKLEFNSLIRRLRGSEVDQATPSGAAKAKRSKNGQTASSDGQTQQLTLFETSSESAPPEPTAEPTPIPHVVKTIIVDTDQVLTDLVQVLNDAPAIAFDTETTDIDQLRAILVGISLAVNGDEGYYIPVGHIATNGAEAPRQLPLQQVIDALRPAMTDPTKPKYAHHAAYDLVMLRRFGLDVRPITFDTMLGEWLLRPDSKRKGLKDQAQIRLNVYMTHIQDLIGTGKKQLTMDVVPVERAAPYAAADAAITYRLVEPIRVELDQHALGPLFTEIEMPLVPVIADLNMTGALLDLPYLTELSQEFAARLDEIKHHIYELAGEEFNIGSPKQLNELLFEKLKLPTKGLRKAQHGYSVDADALEALSEHHKVVQRILDWRGLEKLKNTYVDALPKQVDAAGRVHTTYNQTGSITGRVSSENPNLQNIPIRTEEGRRVRKAFIAPPGCHLVGVDYSQIELRILAQFSGDTFLVDAFNHDQDIHRATAAAVTGVPFDQITKEQRYFAKRVNFGLLYGMGAARLVRESGEMSYAAAKDFIDKYFERLPGVKAYLDGSKVKAMEQGYLETLRGRRRDFSILADPTLRHVERARLEREAINMPVQGTAADIIKIAMIRVSERLKVEHSRARLILQVHDELVLEVPDEDIMATAALVREVMEAAFKLNVPLRADANVGLNWTEMQPIATQ